MSLQPIFICLISFFPQHWVHVAFGGWRLTTRSANAALTVVGRQLGLGGRLPLLSARPAFNLVTLNRAATSFAA